LRSSLRRFAPAMCALVLLGFAGTARADDPAIKVEATEGTALSKKDETAVKKVLSDYMAALQKRDYDKAGEMLDRESLLATVDPMVATIAGDSTHVSDARTKIYGVSTRDSIEARSNGQLFTSLMGYMVTVNPNAAEILAHASLQVLAARKLGDKVHVAYQVTLPPTEPGGMPYEQITAQQMRKVDGKWRILFSLDQ
jgi:hypothetical protein